MEGLGSSHPEVMLDVHVFEISKTLVHKFGLQIPNQFNLFNIPIGALGLTLAGGQSIQDAINQLIASGGINQGNSSALAGLLGQLLGGNAASILSQPLATFGGGITLFGVSLGTLTAEFSMNEGMLRSLEHVTLRAAQGKDATVNLGSRIPIINASFAPIFNTSAISQAIGNGSYIAPIPSFTYEDIGLNLKVKPCRPRRFGCKHEYGNKGEVADGRQHQRRAGDRKPRIHGQHQRQRTTRQPSSPVRSPVPSSTALAGFRESDNSRCSVVPPHRTQTKKMRARC